MAETALITGANRGLGLGLVKVYLAAGYDVLATARNLRRADALDALLQQYPRQLVLLALDVDSDSSVAEAARSVSRETDSLDILINNAGIFPEPSSQVGLSELDFDHCRKAFETNVLGPMRVTRELLPLLEKAPNPRVANISSGAGNIAEKSASGYYAYGTSKAALNFVTRAMAFELKERGVAVVAVSPGWVRTEMGGEGAELSPQQSAEGILRTIDSLTIVDTGNWFNWNGLRKDRW